MDVVRPAEVTLEELVVRDVRDPPGTGLDAKADRRAGVVHEFQSTRTSPNMQGFSSNLWKDSSAAMSCISTGK